MIIKTFFIIFLIGGVSSESCSSVNDCEQPYQACISGSCTSCNSNADCISNSKRKKCYSGGFFGSLKLCAECTSNSDCSAGQTCVTDDKTYLCATTCTGPSDTCTANSQCIYISDDEDFYCLSCENDADCRKWSGNSVSTCNSGICLPAFVSCEQNSDCTSLASSKCSSNVCQPCSQDSHCSRFTVTPVCNSGMCVQCKSDTNCVTTAAPRCSSNNCVSCTANNHCIRFTATPVCNLSGGTCVQCVNHSDCPTEAASKCSFNTCIPCTENDHCSRFSSAPFCSNPSGGTCVQCVSDSDCPTTAAARCLSNTCTTCTLNSQCTHLAPNSLCNTTNGECVECLSISDCTGGKICSPSGVCVGCTSSTQCTLNSALFCNTTIGECVECLADADCLSATESHCSLDSNICAPCTISSQCEHLPDTPLCNTTLGGICVECNIDSDCSSALTAHCSSASNTCVSCTDSVQCSHLSLTPVCNVTTGACVECIADTDCPSTPASMCSSANNTCVPCYHYQNSCYTDCPNGTSPNSTDYTCIQNIATCKSASDCIAAADKARPECNGTMCVACSTDADCQKWYNQVEMTCNLTSGACVLAVGPVLEAVAAAASAVTTSAVVAVSGAAAISTFSSAGSASRGFSTLRITKIAALVRFVNINAPYQAEKLFEGFSTAQNFMKKILSSLFNEEQYNQTMINLPKRFVKFGDSSLFLKNAGMPVLTSVFVGLSVIICRIGMHKARVKRNRTWIKRFQDLQKILEWNYILGMIMASYPELILGFGLQIYDLPFSNLTPLSFISFAICALVIPVSILFPLLTLFLMSAKSKDSNHKHHNISKYEVLIADFMENNSNTKIYQVIGLLRIQVMVFPLIFWQDNPLAQILFMIAGSIVAIFFHVTKVSYKNKFTNFVILTNELLLLVSMIGMLLHISTSSDLETNNANLTSTVVGWIIASTLTAIMVFNAVVSLAGLLKSIWTAIKDARKRPQVPPISKPSLDLSTQSIQHLAASSANTSTLNLSQANEVVIKKRRIKIRLNVR